jgi:hypothetical protein
MREQGAMRIWAVQRAAGRELARLLPYSADLDETRRLVASDPSVVAGRIDVEVFNWWTMKGALEFPAQ